MKRADHARLVGIGREVPPYVDKYPTRGKLFRAREVIEAQLRGEPDLTGEKYGKNAERLSIVNERRAKR